MPVNVQCKQCGKAQSVIPARAETYKFCSVQCRAEWRKTHFVGNGNPRWQEAKREKMCEGCGQVYRLIPPKPLSSFLKSKFCSKQCADKHGFRYSGESHANWTGGKSKRGGKYAAWAKAVISRDLAKCTKCGASGVELHAHHLAHWKEHPELRFELSNGITVGAPCHWAIHSASNENGVNSGKLLPGKAGDNPEPSRSGNIAEGVTTRGRAYRRWHGACEWCGTFISKRLSSVNPHNFCSRTCSGKFNVANKRTTFGRQ